MRPSRFRLDPRLARIQAQRPGNARGAAPHWLRCEWYYGTKRCRLAEGHPGKHEFGNGRLADG